MKTYKELLKAQEELEIRIGKAREAEIGDALAEIRSLVHEFGLTNEDIFGQKRKMSAKPVAPKYRDPGTGATWSGRGKPPRWIAGKQREDFAVT